MTKTLQKELEKLKNNCIKVRSDISCYEQQCADCKKQYELEYCPKSYAQIILDSVEGIEQNSEQIKQILKKI